MFSQMSFCHSVQGVPHVTVGHDALDFTLQGPPTSPDMGLGTLSGPVPPVMGHPVHPLLVTCGGNHWKPVQTSLLDLTVHPPTTHTLVLTSSGHHQSMYGWQADSTYPTEMLSCYMYFYFHQLINVAPALLVIVETV